MHYREPGLHRQPGFFNLCPRFTSGCQLVTDNTGCTFVTEWLRWAKQMFNRIITN